METPLATQPEVTKLKNSDSGSAIAIVVIALLIVAIAAVSLLNAHHPESPIEVLGSLEPSTIKVGERSKLTLTFNNLDLKTHEVTLIFNTNPRILIYEGSEQLLQNNSYTFILEAADPSETRVFTLTGNIESGILSANYPIAYSVHADGNRIQQSWSDAILTIQRR
jgi:hypothetical protein